MPSRLGSGWRQQFDYVEIRPDVDAAEIQWLRICRCRCSSPAMVFASISMIELIMIGLGNEWTHEYAQRTADRRSDGTSSRTVSSIQSTAVEASRMSGGQSRSARSRCHLPVWIAQQRDAELPRDLTVRHPGEEPSAASRSSRSRSSISNWTAGVR